MKTFSLFFVVVLSVAAGCSVIPKSQHSRVMKQMKDCHEETLKAMDYRAEEIEAAKKKGLSVPVSALPAIGVPVARYVPNSGTQRGPTYNWQASSPPATVVVQSYPNYSPGWVRVVCPPPVYFGGGYYSGRVYSGRNYNGGSYSGGQYRGGGSYTGSSYSGSSYQGGRYSGSAQSAGGNYVGGSYKGGSSASQGNYSGKSYTGSSYSGGKVYR